MSRNWVVYREIHLVVFIFFIVFMIPVIHIIIHVFCDTYSRKITQIFHGKTSTDEDILLESNKNTQNVKNKQIKLKYSTKMVLLFSLVFSFLYMVTAIVNVIYFFIKPNKSVTFHVIIAYVVTVGNYVVGRSLLYLYFTFRARDTFIGTFLEYGTATIVFMIIMAVFVPIILVSSITYVQLTFFDGVITDVSHDNGTIVHIKAKDGEPHAWKILNVILALSVLIDLAFACYTLYLLVSKLFKLFYVSSQMNLMDNKSMQRVSCFHSYTKQDNRMVCLVLYIFIYVNKNKKFRFY